MNTDLETTDLVVDQVYGGSRNGNASDDPLPKLLGVDNGAGFRHLGKRSNVETLKLLVLKSNFNDPDWPDNLNTETGVFTYYGDNRKPGDLHKTPRQGNAILKNLFLEAEEQSLGNQFPPIFVFGGTGVYRDVRFLGLAVPGTLGANFQEDLVALWRATGNDDTRFQNYRARFTILNVPLITRDWICDIQVGRAFSSKFAPLNWRIWVNERKYTPLQAPASVEVRTKGQQLPTSKIGIQIIGSIIGRYKDDPYGFELCALEIAKLVMPSIHNATTTRPTRDGGRDAVGKYRIGHGRGSISVEFALEAKCYSKAGVGVKELARLISRLRHRQFGILVTTSFLSKQAYEELKEDGHPIIVLAADDISSILIERFSSVAQVNTWIDRFSGSL